MTHHSDDAETPRTTLQQVLFNSGTWFTAQIFTRLLTFVLVIVIGRWLGTAALGRYSFAMTVLIFCEVFTDFGLRPLLMREVARTPDRASRFFGSALVLKALLAGIAFVAVGSMFGVFELSRDVEHLTLLAVAGLIPLLLFNTLNALFLALERMFWEAILVTLRQAGFAVGGVALLALNAPLAAVFVWLVAVNSVSAIAALEVYRRYFAPLADRLATSQANTADSSAARRDINVANLARLAAPFAVTGFVQIMYFKVDIVMLTLMRGEAEVGLYSMAYRFIEALNFASISLMSALFPVYSRMFSDDRRDSLASLHQIIAGVLAGLGALGALGLVTVGPPFLALVVGDEFEASGTMLWWLAPALFLLAVNSAFVTLINGCDRARRVTRATIASFIVNVAANLIFIPTWGMYGAAAATLLSEIVILVLLAFDARRLLRLTVRWARLLVPIGIGATVWIIALYLLRYGLYLTTVDSSWYLVKHLMSSTLFGILAASVFIGVLLLTGVISRDKISLLRDTLEAG